MKSVPYIAEKRHIKAEKQKNQKQCAFYFCLPGNPGGHKIEQHEDQCQYPAVEVDLPVIYRVCDRRSTQEMAAVDIRKISIPKFFWKIPFRR